MSTRIHDWTVSDPDGNQYCLQCGEERCKMTETAECEGYEAPTYANGGDGSSRVLDVSRS